MTKVVFTSKEDFIKKQGRRRPLDTPKRMIERKIGRRKDIEREGEIREIDIYRERER